MTKEWSHLPNAKHIDWVLETLGKNPKVWDAVRYKKWAAAWVARNVAFGALWRAARSDEWAAALGAVDAVRYAPRYATTDTAWSAIEALIAWDDSGRLLDMPVKKVTKLFKTGNYAAVLLLPAVIVKHRLNKPRLFLDEGAWCALLGNNLQDGICGYGDSPAEAMQDYEKNKLKESA